jgi:NTP pyrophosphatase (non-canonical NTP hydrolase)
MRSHGLQGLAILARVRFCPHGTMRNEVRLVKDRKRSLAATVALSPNGRGSRDLAALTSALRDFAREREWEKFHSPKNLAIALSVEAAGLLEQFQWLTEQQSIALSKPKRSEIADELADVQIYLLMLADKLRVDLARAVEAKIEKNRLRYPAERVRGSAKKARRPASR